MNKGYLIKYRIIMNKVDRWEEKLYRLDSKINSIQSPALKSEPSSSIKITLDDLLIQKKEIEERINNFLKDARKLRTEIEDALDNLENDNEARVLDLYFLSRMNLLKISQVLNYSERHVTRLYVDGIKSIQCEKLSE
jgi:DNA-directed RNA polymerase specialized sigma subunit